MMYLEEHSMRNAVQRIAKPEICNPGFKIFNCNFLSFHLNAWVPTEEVLYVLAVVYNHTIINIKSSSVNGLQESGLQHNH